MAMAKQSGAVGLSLLLWIGACAGRSVIRSAIHAEYSPAVAAARAPAEPAHRPDRLVKRVEKPRKLLHYETYISPSGRECWLNRANEQVCK